MDNLMIEHIKKYFPALSVKQVEQFEQMMGLYKDWNEKINLVSRKDIDNLEVNHILHSLAIAKFISFTPGTRIMDLGAGGGFPSIPLAVLFPEVSFHLIDRIGKKLNVAKDIAGKIGLQNVSFQHGDSGECHEKFDFIVSRGVMPQPDLLKASSINIRKECKNAIPNGVISLKGGDLNAELRTLRERTEIVDIYNYFSEDFFSTKKIVYTIA